MATEFAESFVVNVVRKLMIIIFLVFMIATNLLSGLESAQSLSPCVLLYCERGTRNVGMD